VATNCSSCSDTVFACSNIDVSLLSTNIDSNWLAMGVKVISDAAEQCRFKGGLHQFTISALESITVPPPPTQGEIEISDIQPNIKVTETKVTTMGAHNFQDGDNVIFTQIQGGMSLLNGQSCTVSTGCRVCTPNIFSCTNIDSRSFPQRWVYGTQGRVGYGPFPPPPPPQTLVTIGATYSYQYGWIADASGQGSRGLNASASFKEGSVVQLLGIKGGMSELNGMSCTVSHKCSACGGDKFACTNIDSSSFPQYGTQGRVVGNDRLYITDLSYNPEAYFTSHCKYVPSPKMTYFDSTSAKCETAETCTGTMTCKDFPYVEAAN